MERALIALLLLSGCSHPVPAPITIPSPGEWAMEPCEPWPELDGEGRVSLADASRAAIEAKVSYAECDARHTALRDYVLEVVKPDK